MAKAIRERAAELARATAVSLGFASDDSATWEAFRAALEADNQREIERLQGKLGLSPRHVEFARLALRLDAEITAAVEAAEKAKARLPLIEREFEALDAMAPQTTKDAMQRAERVEALRLERIACRAAIECHAANSGVRQAVPELWNLDNTRRPRAGVHHTLLNFASEHLNVSIYSQSWLDVPTIAQPRRKARVTAAGAV